VRCQAPVLITTDLDRTLIFSRLATRELGGALPADAIEVRGGRVTGELSHLARDSLRALPSNVRLCPATSRNPGQLARLRLPFPFRYGIAANGGVVLVDGDPDPAWSGRTRRELAEAAPADAAAALLASFAGSSWLLRSGVIDEMSCFAIVDPAKLPADVLAVIADRSLAMGWRTSLIGRKLHLFPAGFGKERAAVYVAERVAEQSGLPPLRLAAGDAEHDRSMLAAADHAWTPAGSDIARDHPGQARITRLPGHAAAAQITREWLEICLS
jgi:hypothetical protein